MKFLIDGVIWEVLDHSSEYVIYKNGKSFETRWGHTFETESGACYAILNEYKINN